MTAMQQLYRIPLTDEENVGEYTHINMINSANRYVYATTPYLKIDNDENSIAAGG